LKAILEKTISSCYNFDIQNSDLKHVERPHTTNKHVFHRYHAKIMVVLTTQHMRVDSPDEHLAVAICELPFEPSWGKRPSVRNLKGPIILEY
jgi:hypothetical protein